MPSGIAEVLAASMEPVAEYEKVLGVLRAFTGHNPAKVRAAIMDECRRVLCVEHVFNNINSQDNTRTLSWGPTQPVDRALILQKDEINIDWIIHKNYDRIKAMSNRNNDRRDIIKAIDQPEMVEIDMLLKKYTELTYRLSEVMRFGTKLFWDKSAIQAAYGMGWTLPQKFPF